MECVYVQSMLPPVAIGTSMPLIYVYLRCMRLLVMIHLSQRTFSECLRQPILEMQMVKENGLEIPEGVRKMDLDQVDAWRRICNYHDRVRQ